MQEFTKVVLDIIGQIPEGKVMTYGQIAGWADSPRSARQVARILHGMSDAYELPWHRVINKQGKISLTGQAGAMQKALLEREGIVFKQGKIDLDVYRWKIAENK
jgi:methylated-DNA-protein-cysteine methyltransferase-like protein